MKTHFLYLLGILLFCQHSMGQSNDRQWLIWNNIGKQGTVGSTPANNFPTTPTPNSIANDFTLQAVSMPDIVTQPTAGNALFIIYNDGTHFNSEINSPTGLFYLGPLQNPAIGNHHFTPPGVAPAYLYLSNKYEEDDDPAGVMVNPGSNPSTTSAYSPGRTSSPMLSSTHDVVLGRDITLIINYDTLLAAVQEKEGNFTLEIDGVHDLFNTAIPYYTTDFLDLSPVFQIGSSLSAVYTFQQSGPGPNSITLTPTAGGFEYVNVRNNSAAYGLGPQKNGDPNYNAVFTIKYNGAVVETHEQAILNSYDPNFLEVTSITKKSGYYDVGYHLEFENTSPIPATSLSVEITFPDGFHPHHEQFIRWIAKNSNCSGTMVNVTANTFKFTFSGNQAINHTVNPNTGIAFINFKVKVEGIDVEDWHNSLRLGTPTVTFDSNPPFPVVEFRDLVTCLRDTSTLNCFRPVIKSASISHSGGCPCWMLFVAVVALAIIAILLILVNRRKP